MTTWTTPEYEQMKAQKADILRRIPADTEQWVAQTVARLFPENATLPSRVSIKNKSAEVARALRQAFLMGRAL